MAEIETELLISDAPNKDLTMEINWRSSEDMRESGMVEIFVITGSNNRNLKCL